MQMTLVALGKTQSKWIAEGIAVYEKRLRHYGKFRFVETPDVKLKQSKADPLQVMKAEALVVGKTALRGGPLDLIGRTWQKSIIAAMR